MIHTTKTAFVRHRVTQKKKRVTQKNRKRDAKREGKELEYDGSNKKQHEISEEDCERLASLVHCPAVMKNGRHATTKDGKPITCDMCRKCYTKTGRTTAVYSH